MGLLGGLFSNSFSLNEEWKTLTSTDQVEQLKAVSESKPVAILKHSSRCGVSSSVLSRLKGDWNISADHLEFYFLDLITYREVSKAVENAFNVRHESPQLIVIKNGKAIFQRSHFDIKLNELKGVVEPD